MDGEKSIILEKKTEKSYKKLRFWVFKTSGTEFKHQSSNSLWNSTASINWCKPTKSFAVQLSILIPW